MRSASSMTRALQENFGAAPSSLLVAVSSFLVFAFVALRFTPQGKKPYTLRDPIPRLFNTLQFMLNNHKFMVRVQKAAKDNGLIRFYLGPKVVYLVSGPQSIKAIFGRELVHNVTNQEPMTEYALPRLYKMNRDEVQRWRDDRSGVTRIPLPGTENTPSRERLWFMHEHIYTEYLGKRQFINPLVDMFSRNLSDALEQFSASEWTTVSIREFCRREVTESAISVLFGPNLVSSCEDFVDRFWNFDKHVFSLLLGLPKWINSAPAKAHDHYIMAIEEWLGVALKEFDWDGPKAEAEWEPSFGGRVTRELAKWTTELGWRREVIAATLGATAFALNSNSVPTITWILLEIIKDPALFQSVRDEVATVTTTDPETGKVILDTKKLVTLPILQSIFTETLRLRINFNIMRDVQQPITLDGHTIAGGSMIQAPMFVAHYDEAIWGAAGHPASKFWAERHVKYTTETDAAGQTHHKREYSAAGRPTSYFPFGGGANMCPGRQFAKSQVLTAIGLVVSQFDIELLGWTMSDGSPSDRAAESDLRYSGAGAMPPDRDMKIKWKRIA